MVYKRRWLLRGHGAADAPPVSAASWQTLFIGAATAIVPLFSVTIPQPSVEPASGPAAVARRRRSVISDLVEGFRNVQSRRALFALFISGALGGLLVIAAVTFPNSRYWVLFDPQACEVKGWLQTTKAENSGKKGLTYGLAASAKRGSSPRTFL